MKRTLCLILALALCLALGIPAAAESPDEQLKRVTLQVKTTLDVGDDYDAFNGDSYVYAGRTWWRLSWSKDDESLNVTSDDEGKVYAYDRYFYNEDYVRASGLHFPAFGREEAAAAAERFLPTVLGDGEGFVLDEQRDSLRDYGRYYLSGSLTLKGVPTEVGIRLVFRSADGLLTSFRRTDEETFITGPVPSATPALGEAEAIEALRAAVGNELSWSYTDYETHEARLFYQVSMDSSVMVDAQTGELRNRWNGFRGYSNASGGASEPEEAAAADEAKGLTPQELAGAEKLVGVLDGEALKAAALREAAFGLTEDFVLGSVTYRSAQPSVDPAALAEGEEPDDTVTAYYRLTRTLDGPEYGLTQEEYDGLLRDGYTPTVVKQITADARTGEVQYLYTNYSGFGWRDKDDPKDAPVVSPAALAFLQERYGSRLPLCEQSRAEQHIWSVPVDSFTYTRMEAGYPCPMNTISVSVNHATGFVDSFSAVWDEELRFGPSGPLVGEEAAVDSFLACYRAKLCYVTVPEDPDNWESPRSWLLVYLPESEGWVSGVDAVTGEADLSSRSGGETVVSYGDLSGSYARKEIETLAAYGVGFYGVDEFRPAAQVTELDMLLFMLSAVGWQPDYETYANAGEEELARLYSAGYSQGFLDTREQQPGRIVTRSELCRCFVSLSGLEEAARLQGIYRCGFTDEEDIPAADLGFVAIAKGLGVVCGDTDGAFRPGDGATRQELAVMLFRYLSR